MTFYVSKKLVSVYIAFLFLPFFSLLVIDFTSPTISYSLFHSFLFFLISSFYSLIFVPFRSLSRFNFNLTSVACPAIKILSFLGLFLFIINILITISSFEYIQINDIDITTLKNTGIANDVIKSSYNPVLVFLVRLFSPLGYLCLLLFFITIRRIALTYSLLLLLASFNIFMIHFHVFSRSFVVIYLIVFFMLTIFFRVNFKHLFPVFFVYFLRPLVFGVFLLFLSVSIFRFNDMGYWHVYTSYNGSLDVVTFSLFHYLSNSFLVFHYLYFNELSPNFVGSFSQSLGFIPFIDLENFNFLDVTSNFKGLFLTNIYDLGLLFFTLSFFLIFILRFIYFPLIFRLISSFFGFFFFASSFFGSPLVYSYFFLGVIYTIIFLPIFIKSVKNA